MPFEIHFGPRRGICSPRPARPRLGVTGLRQCLPKDLQACIHVGLIESPVTLACQIIKRAEHQSAADAWPVISFADLLHARLKSFQCCRKNSFEGFAIARKEKVLPDRVEHPGRVGCPTGPTADMTAEFLIVAIDRLDFFAGDLVITA